MLNFKNPGQTGWKFRGKGKVKPLGRTLAICAGGDPKHLGIMAAFSLTMAYSCYMAKAILHRICELWPLQKA